MDDLHLSRGPAYDSWNPFDIRNTRRIKSASPFKGQIDLNIQSKWEGELSPGSDSGGMMKVLQDVTDWYPRQQRVSSSGGSGNSFGNQSQLSGDGDGAGGEKLILGRSHSDAIKDRPATASTKANFHSWLKDSS